ncbi:S1C family serine protease [Minwuia sp.]|uniref:S1C family serine protease n=1 Tax=Minwuia sp. TaxID=2493630 RepID=UPI003A9034C4
MTSTNLIVRSFPSAAVIVAAVVMICTGHLVQAQERNPVERAIEAVVRIDAEVPGDARTAGFLGTQRTGSGVVIDDSGLVLTIGYLVLEAMAVTVTNADGAPVAAEIIAYDYDTGLGLVRAQQALGRPPIRLGDSAAVVKGDPVLVATEPGIESAQPGAVVDVRRFTGYWEYLLEDALFVSPPHAAWQGAALIGAEGELLGIGSLFAEDAQRRPKRLPGTMFVPVNALKPILAELLTEGRSAASNRPWLGIFTSDHRGYVVVTYVAPDGPAAASGVRRGDVVLEVGGQRIRTMAEFLETVWSQGLPGVEVPLTLGRQDHVARVKVISADRYAYMKLDKTF